MPFEDLNFISPIGEMPGNLASAYTRTNHCSAPGLVDFFARILNQGVGFILGLPGYFAECLSRLFVLARLWWFAVGLELVSFGAVSELVVDIGFRGRLDNPEAVIISLLFPYPGTLMILKPTFWRPRLTAPAAVKVASVVFWWLN